MKPARTTRRKLPRHTVNPTFKPQRCFLHAALLVVLSATLYAQEPTTLTLPDSPGTVLTVSSSSAPSSSFDPPQKPLSAPTRTDKYILPGEVAPQLNAQDKFLLGLKDAISPLSALGWLASAGYSQVTDSAPQYSTGSTGKDFAQRLGASAARAASEGILSDSIMSPLFREDPRYYKMGKGHSFGKRLVYSATRAIITRTDSGHQTINLGLLAGNLEGAALTNAYYPQRNRSASQTMETFAGSVGGSALGFVVSEFLSDTLQFVHLKDRD